MTSQLVAIGDFDDGTRKVAVTSTGALKVDGSTAGGGTTTANQGTANTAVNGWPVKITDGTDTALVTATGELSVDTELPAAAALSDGVASPTTPTVGAVQLQYNAAAGVERTRANEDMTVFASTARTATPTPFDSFNRNARGLHLVIDVTAIAATPSVTFTIQGKDEVSGKFYTILASAAITGTGTTILRVFPGSTVTANLAANDIIPRQFRVIATHGDADSITYSCGVSLIL